MYIVSSGLECLLMWWGFAGGVGRGGGNSGEKTETVCMSVVFCGANEGVVHYLLCSLREGKAELTALKH